MSENRANYPIAVMCRILGVSASFSSQSMSTTGLATLILGMGFDLAAVGICAGGGRERERDARERDAAL